MQVRLRPKQFLRAANLSGQTQSHHDDPRSCSPLGPPQVWGSQCTCSGKLYQLRLPEHGVQGNGRQSFSQAMMHRPGHDTQQSAAAGDPRSGKVGFLPHSCNPARQASPLDWLVDVESIPAVTEGCSAHGSVLQLVRPACALAGDGSQRQQLGQVVYTATSF